jgi:hypothetical protein
MLEEIAREEAREQLRAAREREVEERLAGYAQVRDDRDRQLVVRNGHTPERANLQECGREWFADRCLST